MEVKLNADEYMIIESALIDYGNKINNGNYLAKKEQVKEIKTLMEKLEKKAEGWALTFAWQRLTKGLKK